MVEGLKEALQYITGLKAKSMEPKLVEIEGRTYCTDNDLTRYHRFPMASDIEVNTLTALVDYIKGKPEELRESSVIHVVSPTKVLLYSGLIDERNRETLIDARAIVNEFSFDSYYDQERFLIELQANFVETDDLITIMQVAGNIKSGTTANYSDDGVSQKTTIKTGVELVIYGPCVNPKVLMNGYPYEVLTTLEKNEYLIINSSEQTIMKYLSNGTIANLFDVRGYDYSVFEKIPSGLISVNWSGDFGIDLYVFLKRKEAAW